MFMSAKTVSSEIIPIVNRKGNIIYLQRKLSFSFHSFSVNILPVLKSEAFTWGEEWVIAVQTILW